MRALASDPPRAAIRDARRPALRLHLAARLATALAIALGALTSAAHAAPTPRVAAQSEAPAVQRPTATAVWVDPQRLVLDGDPSEWRGSAANAVVIDRFAQLVSLTGRAPRENWSGVDDLSLRVWLGWTATDLVIGGEVRDDAPREHVEGSWFEGDSLELFLDFGARDQAWDARDWQVMLAPNWPQRPWGVYPRGDQAAGREREGDAGFGGVEVTAVETATGYRFEARLPWRNFGPFDAQPGAVIGFNLAACDRDRSGQLEHYATWTEEAQLAAFADRRADLVLAPRTGAPPAATSATTDGESAVSHRPLLLVGLAVLYGVALWTRRLWRSAHARRIAAWSALALLVVSGAVAVAARIARQRQVENRAAEVAAYWTSFERVVASGALGVLEPSELLAAARELVAGRSIAPPERIAWRHATPRDRSLGVARRTSRRGVPYRPFLGASGQPEGFSLQPGRSVRLLFDPQSQAGAADVLQLVTRVRDRRYERAGAAESPVLAIDLLSGGQPVRAPIEMRHGRELHFEENVHRDVPDLEPVYFTSSGRGERVHGDALIVRLGQTLDVDEIVIRHVGAPSSYAVDLVALAAGVRDNWTAPPASLRANPDGQWSWARHSTAIEVEMTAPGRAPRKLDSVTLVRTLRVAEEPLGAAYVRDLLPPPSSAQDMAPLAALALMAPFLVTMFAQWLSTGKRMRGKLAVGFVATSAAPLLALTLLLDASLRNEHERNELERVRGELVRAEQGLDTLAKSLERDAQRLLRLASMRKLVDGVYPQTPEELLACWGESDGSVRLLERTGHDGQRITVGLGPNAAQLRAFADFGTGLVRPRGQLLVCGVAQTTPGAEQPLKVVVARTPDFPDSTAAAAPGAVRLVGAGRDGAPRATDVLASGAGELRRALYDTSGQTLAGVLVGRVRARASPVLGDFTLIELLLAAGITALFTVALFAGILTGGVVGPIERLDRALRRSQVSDVKVEVDDEIGRLAGAIRAYSAEVAERVEQLEVLQEAQGELARRLDPDEAREAVLQFFQRHARARSVWLAWRGEPGEGERVFGEGGRSLPAPDHAGVLQRALCCGELLQFVDPNASSALSDFEQVLLGSVRRVVCVPLVAGGETRGALVLGYESEAAPTNLAFLRAAANQAATVLENARLYAQATHDAVTGFLTDPGFRQRLAEEIQRARGEASAGVALVRLRLSGLPRDDQRAGERLREAAKRIRLAVRGMALFGRSGAADLIVALPWTGRAPAAEPLARRLAERVSTGPWPDGEPVAGLFVAHASHPEDGASARSVLATLEDRLSEAQLGMPTLDLVRLAPMIPADFVAASPLMLQLLETVRRLAEQDLGVLIVGETGSGKDRIAGLLHRWSARAAGPLVHVHCPSLSSTLIEDELLGHEKGAFTGAVGRRRGPFEFAAGGVVVLDEIGGLAPAGQVALLRLLETREVLPLGASRPTPIDVRVVATSSIDLAEAVQRGEFRSDLYFRLNVAQVVVPPLRQRRADIPELVAAFLRRHNSTADRPVTGVDPHLLDVLLQHDWPGNVRELENLVFGGCVLARGGELTEEHVVLTPSPAAGAEGGGAGLNERQERLLAELGIGQRVTSADFAEREGVSARTALRDLMELVERGYLEREGSRRGARFRRLPGPIAVRSGR